mmetsp:Transcript_32613/g.96874  ORF Transcript_32613/g.96874 Transcript_32613/m.96874 type:complete len:243 (+) Transcript_32613:752-1480(+)
MQGGAEEQADRGEGSCRRRGGQRGLQASQHPRDVLRLRRGGDPEEVPPGPQEAQDPGGPLLPRAPGLPPVRLLPRQLQRPDRREPLERQHEAPEGAALRRRRRLRGHAGGARLGAGAERERALVVQEDLRAQGQPLPHQAAEADQGTPRHSQGTSARAAEGWQGEEQLFVRKAEGADAGREERVEGGRHEVVAPRPGGRAGHVRHPAAASAPGGADEEEEGGEDLREPLRRGPQGEEGVAAG